MRARRKVSAADAGGQLPLLGESGARNVSSGSGGRRKLRTDETSTTPSGTDEDCLSDFVIFLWFLSNAPTSTLDWAGLEFTVENAAKHHALFFEQTPEPASSSGGVGGVVG